MAATEGDATLETLRVFSHARDLLARWWHFEGTDDGPLGYPTWPMPCGGSILPRTKMAQQCLALAAEHEHPGISAMANRFMGQTLYFMGAFGDARSHLERTLALCAANQATIASYRRFGADDQVTSLSALSRTLWILGFPEQAADAAQRALARARSLGFAFTIAFALDGEALLGILGGDRRRAAAHADEGLAHSIEHSLADYEQRARFIQGALLAQGGDPLRGTELMNAAIIAIERTNSLNRRTLYLGHYAAARASLGEPEAGLDLLEQAVEIAEKTNERFFETELYRLRGKMLLTLGRTDAAEVALRRALKIAQQQQARWWELRTATTLAKHWHNEGKHAEAYALLHPVCGWFVEGRDTVDLQAAKALQDELGNFLGLQAKASGG